MTSDLLHTDDTPIRVLDRSRRDKGLGKGVKKGRIWAYVRDQRPWAGAAPPGALYQFAPLPDPFNDRQSAATSQSTTNRHTTWNYPRLNEIPVRDLPQLLSGT